jgi:hypothetical protein
MLFRFTNENHDNARDTAINGLSNVKQNKATRTVSNQGKLVESYGPRLT